MFCLSAKAMLRVNKLSGHSHTHMLPPPSPPSGRHNIIYLIKIYLHKESWPSIQLFVTFELSLCYLFFVVCRSFEHFVQQFVFLFYIFPSAAEQRTLTTKLHSPFSKKKLGRGGAGWIFDLCLMFFSCHVFFKCMAEF